MGRSGEGMGGSRCRGGEREHSKFNKEPKISKGLSFIL